MLGVYPPAWIKFLVPQCASPSSSESNARTGVSLRRQLTERCNTVHHCTVKPAHLPHHQSVHFSWQDYSGSTSPSSSESNARTGVSLRRQLTERCNTVHHCTVKPAHLPHHQSVHFSWQDYSGSTSPSSSESNARTGVSLRRQLTERCNTVHHCTVKPAHLPHHQSVHFSWQDYSGSTSPSSSKSNARTGVSLRRQLTERCNTVHHCTVKPAHLPHHQSVHFSWQDYSGSTSPSSSESNARTGVSLRRQLTERCNTVHHCTVKPAHLPHHQSVHFSWQDYSGSTSPSSSESNARTGVSLRRQLTERCNTVHHCTVKPAHLPHHQSVHFSWQDYSGSTSPSSSESNARTGVSLRRQLTERCNTVHHCTVKPAHLPHHQSVHFSWQDYSGSTSPSSSESNARTGVSLRRQLTERCNTVHHCTVKPAHLPHHQSVHFSWQDYSGSTSPSSSESNARTGVSSPHQLKVLQCAEGTCAHTSKPIPHTPLAASQLCM